MAEFQRHAPGGTISQVLKRVEHRYVKPLLRKLKPWRTTTKYAGGFTSKRISMAAAQPSVRISYRSPTSAACPAKTARSSGARVPGLSVFRFSPSGFATRCASSTSIRWQCVRVDAPSPKIGCPIACRSICRTTLPISRRPNDGTWSSPIPRIFSRLHRATFAHWIRIGKFTAAFSVPLAVSSSPAESSSCRRARADLPPRPSAT